MPEIRIAFDLPSFNYDFEWSGTEAEARELLDGRLAAIAERGVDPAVVFASLIVQAPAVLRAGDRAVSIRGMQAMLTAWALQQAAGNPDFPGRVIDYLPTHDFELVIDKAGGGEISATIEARPRDVFVGTA